MTATARKSFHAIKAEMARRIAERVWAPGALIPGEEVLAVEFSCARATVNRALQELARGGVLVRKRKAGTRVALHPGGRTLWVGNDAVPGSVQVVSMLQRAGKRVILAPTETHRKIRIR